MKTCTKCNEVKADKLFATYKKNGTHGLRGYCKACDSLYKKKHYERNKKSYLESSKRQRLRNPEAMREYDRKYYQENRDLKREQYREYRNTPEGRKAIKRAYCKYRSTKEGRIKESVRNVLNKAVQSGKIVKPSKCSKCKEKTDVEGHHEDYSKPLEVIWVCKQCHENIHHLNEGHESF